MIDIIPEKLKLLSEALGGRLYVVGGTCRDFLGGLESPVKDWDVCAPVPADEACAAAESVGFTVTAVYRNTGTVRMSADGDSYEYASFRTDRYVRGVHSPAEVYFTDDIFSDARRRDFKCNAIYYGVSSRRFVDPLGGIADVKDKRLSTVAPAEKVFGEDGLRLMRLCRIAAQTGFYPDEECLAGAKKNRDLVRDVAPERIWTELDAVLHADCKYGIKGGQYAGLKLLKETGVMDVILPEIAAGDGMKQRSDYHAYDVLEHTLRCVLYADESIRLAALLHDAGKPYCRINRGNFVGHEEEGARIAGEICGRLRVPKKLAEDACELVRLHMYDLSLGASENKVRKFIVSHVGVIPRLLLLKQADFSACKDDTSEAPCVTKWNGILSKMKEEGVPTTLRELNVRGDELIAAGIPPIKTGEILSFLLGECAIGSLPNDGKKLVSRAIARANEI